MRETFYVAGVPLKSIWFVPDLNATLEPTTPFFVHERPPMMVDVEALQTLALYGHRLIRAPSVAGLKVAAPTTFLPDFQTAEVTYPESSQESSNVLLMSFFFALQGAPEAPAATPDCVHEIVTL